MLGGIEDAEFSSALVSVALLATWDALPVLLLCYALQSSRARRVGPEFGLRRPEATELDRALLIYAKVSRRLNEIDQLDHDRHAFWRVLFSPERGTDRNETDERDDLEAHARYLRENIVRLRRLPLERLRDFVHAVSLCVALKRALALYLAVFAAAAVFFLLQVWDQPGSAPLLHAMARHEFLQGAFEANAAGGCLAISVIPLLYLLQRTTLHREFRLEFHVLGELAATPPDRNNDQTAADPDLGVSGHSDRIDIGTDDWFTILGVAPSATAEQVRQAYRARIKQSHPDRLHEMSPAIQRFADAETKRLNAAYERALLSVE